MPAYIEHAAAGQGDKRENFKFIKFLMPNQLILLGTERDGEELIRVTVAKCHPFDLCTSVLLITEPYSMALLEGASEGTEADGIEIDEVAGRLLHEDNIVIDNYRKTDSGQPEHLGSLAITHRSDLVADAGYYYR